MRQSAPVPHSDRSSYWDQDITHSVHNCVFVTASLSHEAPCVSSNSFPFHPNLHLRSISLMKPYTAPLLGLPLPGSPAILLNGSHGDLSHLFIHSVQLEIQHTTKHIKEIYKVTSKSSWKMECKAVYFGAKNLKSMHMKGLLKIQRKMCTVHELQKFFTLK